MPRRLKIAKNRVWRAALPWRHQYRQFHLVPAQNTTRGKAACGARPTDVWLPAPPTHKSKFCEHCQWWQKNPEGRAVVS